MSWAYCLVSFKPLKFFIVEGLYRFTYLILLRHNLPYHFMSLGVQNFPHFKCLEM